MTPTAQAIGTVIAWIISAVILLTFARVLYLRVRNLWRYGAQPRFRVNIRQRRPYDA